MRNEQFTSVLLREFVESDLKKQPSKIKQQQQLQHLELVRASLTEKKENSPGDDSQRICSYKQKSSASKQEHTFSSLRLTSGHATALLHAASLFTMYPPLCADRALGIEQTHLPR